VARDLLLGRTGRNWSRDPGSSESGHCLVVVAEKPKSHWLGWTLGLVVGTRVLSGQWPWQLTKKIGHRWWGD